MCKTRHKVSHQYSQIIVFGNQWWGGCSGPLVWQSKAREPMGRGSTHSSLTIGRIPSSCMQIWHPTVDTAQHWEIPQQVKVVWLLEVIGCHRWAKGRPSLELLKGNYLLAGSKRQGRIVRAQNKREGRWTGVGRVMGIMEGKSFGRKGNFLG